MKNIGELSGETYLQCPVAPDVWVQMTFYGKPTKGAIFKTMRILEEMYNDWTDEKAGESKTLGDSDSPRPPTEANGGA